MDLDPYLEAQHAAIPLSLVYQSPVSFMSLLGYVEMSLIVFLLRIKKLEKETALMLQCKRNGWTDVSGQLEQYEKVLGNGKHAESKSFYPLQHASRFNFNE